jgi:hypothetical protein
MKQLSLVVLVVALMCCQFAAGSRPSWISRLPFGRLPEVQEQLWQSQRRLKVIDDSDPDVRFWRSAQP